MPRLGEKIDPRIRFQQKVIQGQVARPGLTPCQIWTGAQDKDGYGLFQLESRRTVRAHRWIYETHYSNQLARGTMVRHSCDTPSCVNPEHLSPGTGKQNVADMQERQRHGDRRGSGHHAAKMNERQVLELRRRVAAGEKTYRIFAEFGVTYGQAKSIIARRSWAHLPPE